MSGGGGSPSSQTVTQTTIPEYLRPQVESMVGKAAGLMEGQLSAGYQPYEGQRVAGFSPMQAQAFQQVAGQQVAPQLTDASNLALGSGEAALGYGSQASGIGQAGMAAAQQAAGQASGQAQGYGALGAGYGASATGMAPQAQTYGSTGANIGMQGVGIGGLGVAASGQGFGAQQAYEKMATSPEAQQAYMSPYMQNVVAQQQRDAIRQADIQRQGNQARAVGQGAYGGSRAAIVEAELQKNLAEQLGNIQATGSQQAFQQAQQAQQFGAGLGIQGLQAGLQGLQTGLAGTAQGMQGQQIGLQGIGQAGQLYGLGIQGAQTGLQGVGQQIAAGQLAQQGVSNALQGQSLGIAGSQAATSAAGQLGQLGGQQFQQQMAITDALQKYGALQQAQQQQGLDVDYQNYLASQNFPYQQLGFFSDIVRGLPMSQSTQTMYGGQPSMAAQIPGMLMAGAGYFGGRGAAEGGRIQKYAGGGSVAQEALTLEDARALPSKLRRLSDTQLAAYARSVKDAVTLSSIQSEVQRRAQARQPYNPNATLQPTLANQVAKQAEAASIGGTGMAGGGIVALQEGSFLRDVLNYSGPLSEQVVKREVQGLPPEPNTLFPWIKKLGAYEGIASPERVRREMGIDDPVQPPSQPLYPREQYKGESIPSSEMIAESYPKVARPEPKTGIAAATEAKLAPVNVEGTPPVARTSIAAASPAGRMSYEEWQQQAAPKGFSEADTAVLNDMRSRITQKMERAGKQSDRAIYDSMMMAGLAMMSGNSFADGLMKAAQAGGATFMSSKDKAAKALEAAEEAELSFNKYKMALERNDKKEAADMFKDYTGYVTKLDEIAGRERVAQIQAGARGGAGAGPESGLNKAMIRASTDQALKGLYAQLKDITTNESDKPAILDAINKREQAIYENFNVGHLYKPYSLPAVQAAPPKEKGWLESAKDFIIGGPSINVPQSKDELVKGKTYNTARGPAVWDGSQFVK